MKKRWHRKIRNHIDHWSNSLSGHSWWPKYVYFFADLRNADSILRDGRLLSREQAESCGIMEVNSASREIIDQTREEHLKFVRLYYRPRTPTQYRSEGIRPKAECWKEAHCPVPIFFLFDAYELMGRNDAQYANGSMASPYVRYGPNEEDFDRIPFDKVFHYGRYNPMVEGDIKFHRHAELLIPEALPLKDNLKLISCRTHAERQTLIHLLPFPQLRQWHGLIRIGDSSLFERRWAYVDRVDASPHKLSFYFNPNSQHTGTFEARIILRFPSGKKRQIEQIIDGKEPLTLEWEEKVDDIEAELWLDDSLAYHSKLWIGEIPF